MSRGEPRRRFTVEDHVRATEGSFAWCHRNPHIVGGRRHLVTLQMRHQ
jgi:hypothetical protein